MRKSYLMVVDLGFFCIIELEFETKTQFAPKKHNKLNKNIL